LSWGASAGATYYDLGVVDVSTGSFVVNTTTTSPSYTASLTAGKTYRWNVAAGNSAGLSTYTTVIYFQTPGTKPPTPTSPSPGTTSSPGPVQASSTVTLSWGASSGATYYDLGVVDVATGSFVVNTTTTSTSYAASLTAGKTYRWNVAAGNGAGLSTYTTVIYFQTPIVNGVPTVQNNVATSVTSSSATLNATITDTGGSSITDARFEWTAGSFPGTVIYSVPVSANTFFYNLTGLQPSTTYTFHSFARNSTGWSSAGNNVTFTTSAGGATASELSGVPYIHQVYDTADSFTGGSYACNASAALMTIQYYGKLSPNPITCSRGGTHTSSYGFYVSSIYTYNGHTYNIPSSAVWQLPGIYGGFGYFLQDLNGDSYQRSTRLSEYIAFHGLTSSVDTSAAGESGFAKVCAEIDARHPVVLLTSLTTEGHYVTCIGYVPGQHTLIFNDPYGNKNTGYPNKNGARVFYDWPGYNHGNQNLGTVHRIIYAVNCS